MLQINKINDNFKKNKNIPEKYMLNTYYSNKLIFLYQKKFNFPIQKLTVKFCSEDNIK
jgi:hypothetical protein